MPIVTQAEFARIAGAARSTVAGWIRSGLVSGDAVVRRDERVLLDRDKALHQVHTRRDPAQASGNGRHIRVHPGHRREMMAAAPGDAAPHEAALDAAYRDGLIAGALHMAYGQAADAVFYAEAVGAPMPMLWALFHAFAEDVPGDVAQLCTGPGEKTSREGRAYPAGWDGARLRVPDWAEYARRAGEPHDPAAWQAYADARRRLFEDREGGEAEAVEAPAAA